MIQQLYISANHDRLLDALHDALDRGDLEQQLPAYLRAQRWFGGATRNLQSVQLERWVQLEAKDGMACMCVATALDANGVDTEHILFLYADTPEDGQRVVRDALDLPEIRAELIQMATSGAPRNGYRAELAFESTAAAPAGCEGPGDLMDVEQSNTCIRYDEACILKVYRRLERGGNPEVELIRYLTTQTDFGAAPRVLSVGTLHGTDGFTADVVAVQAWAPNQGDGWAWAVSAARSALDSVASPDDMRGWLEGEQATLQAAARLGTITAQLHAALAVATGEGLQPQPATVEDLEEWTRILRQEAQDAARTVRGARADDEQLVAAIERATAYADRGVQLNSLEDLGLKTRVHGDYHLGQVLRTEDGFVVIDFEGEPVKTLAQRRSLQAPLVDVAGMVRSWSYAAFTAARASAAASKGEDLASSWESAVRETFLDSYWTAADSADPAFLPRDPETRAALLSLFELRKALYEVQYELNNRPDWAEIPAAAVRKLTEDLLT